MIDRYPTFKRKRVADEDKWEGVVPVHVVMDVDLSAHMARVAAGGVYETAFVAAVTKPEEGVNIAVTGMTIEFTMEPFAEGADQDKAESKAIFEIKSLLEKNAVEGICIQDVYPEQRNKRHRKTPTDTGEGV